MSVWKMVILAAGGGLVLASCGSSTTGDNGGCTPKGAAASGATAAQVIKVEADPVNVGKYTPSPAQAKVGDTVEWDFADTGNPHTVTDDAGSFDSCSQSSGAKFLHTFSTAGDYKYSCTIHANMHGDIKVS